MGQTDRPDDRRAAGSRLPSNSESAVKRNHETPKSGIPKRKKIEACPRLSCKIQYLLASNHRDQSTASEYFTDDIVGWAKRSVPPLVSAARRWWARREESAFAPPTSTSSWESRTPDRSWWRGRGGGPWRR